MTVRHVFLAGLAAALALAAFGCNGSADDESMVTEDGASTSKSVAEIDPTGLLTPTDVETVSGLTGLTLVAYAPDVGAGGDVNIADESGQLVAMLVVEDQETWGAWLTDGFTVSGPVTPPVGDEAFIGPNPDVSPATYIFGFRKGDTSVVIDTFFDATGETILSVEELRELAEIVEGRL